MLEAALCAPGSCGHSPHTRPSYRVNQLTCPFPLNSCSRRGHHPPGWQHSDGGLWWALSGVPWGLSCMLNLGEHCSNHHGTEEHCGSQSSRHPLSLHSSETRTRRGAQWRHTAYPGLAPGWWGQTPPQGPASLAHCILTRPPWVPGCCREKTPEAAHGFRVTGNMAFGTDTTLLDLHTTQTPPNTGSGNANSPPSPPSSL